MTCSIAFGQEASTQKTLVEIADNVYSYVEAKDGSPANSFGANAGIIVGEGGVLVIDTLVSAKEARKFIKDIRAVSDKPVRYVVNTHYHLDHAFGNSEFAEICAVIISHADCKANMEKAALGVLNNLEAYSLTEQDMEGTGIAYPSIAFKDRLEVDLGGQKVELIYVAPSHSSGSILVYLPNRKVLFAGDVLFTDFHPFMGEGDIDGWVRTLDYIESLDVEKIVPGHGPVSGKKDVADMRSYLLAFDKKARELAAGSEDIEYIVEEIKKSLSERTMGEWLIRANVQMKYLKGETHGEGQ